MEVMGFALIVTIAGAAYMIDAKLAQLIKSTHESNRLAARANALKEVELAHLGVSVKSEL